MIHPAKSRRSEATWARITTLDASEVDTAAAAAMDYVAGVSADDSRRTALFACAGAAAAAARMTAVDAVAELSSPFLVCHSILVDCVVLLVPAGSGLILQTRGGGRQECVYDPAIYFPRTVEAATQDVVENRRVFARKVPDYCK